MKKESHLNIASQEYGGKPTSQRRVEPSSSLGHGFRVQTGSYQSNLELGWNNLYGIRQLVTMLCIRQLLSTTWLSSWLLIFIAGKETVKAEVETMNRGL